MHEYFVNLCQNESASVCLCHSAVKHHIIPSNLITFMSGVCAGGARGMYEGGIILDMVVYLLSFFQLGRVVMITY